jgi:hypothetical protein
MLVQHGLYCADPVVTNCHPAKATHDRTTAENSGLTQDHQRAQPRLLVLGRSVKQTAYQCGTGCQHVLT